MEMSHVLVKRCLGNLRLWLLLGVIVQGLSGANCLSGNVVHNSTAYCPQSLRGSARRCQRDLLELAQSGWPWFGCCQDGDPIDAMNNACSVLDGSEVCLQALYNPSCLSVYASDGNGQLQTFFHFICHRQPSVTDLLQPLGCLHDTRVLVMLLFHIGNECPRGVEILDDLMDATKNAYFYALNVNPYRYHHSFPGLYCLKERVIKTCVWKVVQKRCGNMTAQMVQEYILYMQSTIGDALHGLGLSRDPCMAETKKVHKLNVDSTNISHKESSTAEKSFESPNLVVNSGSSNSLLSEKRSVDSGEQYFGPVLTENAPLSLVTKSVKTMLTKMVWLNLVKNTFDPVAATGSRVNHGKLKQKQSFDATLTERAPGSALDTVFGRVLTSMLLSATAEELCDCEHLYGAYTACVFLSDDLGEKHRFNLLQYSHQLLSLWYHGSSCHRIVPFQACWDQLKEICGPRTRFFEQHATLLVQGCAIQRYMDAKGCQWQDMLMRQYIRASELTVWPTIIQPMGDPMRLKKNEYSLEQLRKDYKRLLEIVQGEVAEVTAKCGQEAAALLYGFYRNISYSQYDAIKFMIGV